MEKLQLFTIKLRFQSDNCVCPKHCILGHVDEQERDRWFFTIDLMIERKMELARGWKTFRRYRVVGDREKAEQWVKIRSGEASTHVNERARRKARLQNGKVLNDLPVVFERFSEECPSWPRTSAVQEGSPAPRAMDAARVVEALSELGLELSPKMAGRLRDELRRAPACHEHPDKLDFARFERVFHACRREMLVAPTTELKQSLLRIMQDSSNPFLQLLSPAEQMFLLDGRDANGVNTCICRSYPHGAVLVRQDDVGDSMFLVIDGRLSVVVSFGTGAFATQKEVAQLCAGAVMGEMSLVLGKPRSATCVVASDTAAVAEIARSAIIRLLNSRPCLARELEDLVHRRDAANVLALTRAGGERAARALLAYRERGAAAAAPAGGSPAPARPYPTAAPETLGGRMMRRISRTRAGQAGVPRPATALAPRLPAPTLAARPASAVAWAGQWPAAGAAPEEEAAAGAAGRRRFSRATGRWIKGSGAHILLQA